MHASNAAVWIDRRTADLLIQEKEMTEKRFICTDCGKRFGHKSDRKQHWNATDCEYGKGTTIEDRNDPAAQKARDEQWDRDLDDMDGQTRMDVFKSVVDDGMPDGAYFAMASEFGLEPEDFCD